MSSTITRSRRHAAVPQEPAQGPISAPSIAALKLSGRLGAPPWRIWMPSGSSRWMVQVAGGVSRSMISAMLPSVSVSSLPAAMASMISLWA